MLFKLIKFSNYEVSTDGDCENSVNTTHDIRGMNHNLSFKGQVQSEDLTSSCRSYLIFIKKYLKELTGESRSVCGRSKWCPYSEVLSSYLYRKIAVGARAEKCAGHVQVRRCVVAHRDWSGCDSLRFIMIVAGGSLRLIYWFGYIMLLICRFLYDVGLVDLEALWCWFMWLETALDVMHGVDA